MGQLIRDCEAGYLAGHLDGDGSITSNGNGYHRLQWISTHHLTLLEIQRMLSDEGVTAKLKPHSNSLECLCVYRQEDCRFALEKFAPYLVLKSQKAWRVLADLGSMTKERSVSIDWDYAAGFLDTDGHITQQSRWKNGSLTHWIGWTQKGENSMAALEAFLVAKGFHTSKCYLHSGVWQLRVIRQKEVEQVIRNMTPYLITKAAKAREVLGSLEGRAA